MWWDGAFAEEPKPPQAQAHAGCGPLDLTSTAEGQPLGVGIHDTALARRGWAGRGEVGLVKPEGSCEGEPGRAMARQPYAAALADQKVQPLTYGALPLFHTAHRCFN